MQMRNRITTIRAVGKISWSMQILGLKIKTKLHQILIKKVPTELQGKRTEGYATCDKFIYPKR